MSPHIPEIYESIVEASNKGELWGIDKSFYNVNQLEINFSPSAYS